MTAWRALVPRRGRPFAAALLVLSLWVLAAAVEPATVVGRAAPASPSAAPVGFQVLDLPRPDGSRAHLADPEVVKIAGTWYLYGTSSPSGFEAWSSTDLVTWTYGGLVWRPTPGSWNNRGNYWAPGIHVDPTGAVWMYYVADGRIGVAHADGPLGPFVDQLDHPLVGNGYGGVGDGVLREPETNFLDNWANKAIDPSVFEAADGSLTLYFTALTPLSEIRAVPLTGPATVARVKPTVLVSAASGVDSWEWVIREGPFVFEHDGLLYLMYSGNQWQTGCYAIGVATSRNPLGPFTRDPRNPVLATDAAVGIIGPGHNSVVEGPDGNLLAFFHVKDSAAIGSSRSTMEAPIRFDGRGRLVIDPPSGGTPPTPGNPECRPAPPTTVDTTTTTTTTSAPTTSVASQVAGHPALEPAPVALPAEAQPATPVVVSPTYTG